MMKRTARLDLSRPFGSATVRQKAVRRTSSCCPVRSRRVLCALLESRVARVAAVAHEELAERVALRTPPLPGSPWDVLPDDIGKMIGDDFPHLWRARQEEFGRGGRSGTARAIPRSQFVANESAAAAARGKAAREREKTKEAEERAEKTRKLLADSELALFKSQEETDAANERIAGLEDQLRRERQQSAQKEHLKRSEELGCAASARARGPARRRIGAKRSERGATAPADLDKLKTADDERRAEDEDPRRATTFRRGRADDDDAFTEASGRSDRQSTTGWTRSAPGTNRAWDEIYRPSTSIGTRSLRT